MERRDRVLRVFQFRVSGSVPSSREVLRLRKRRWAVSQRGREGQEEPRRCYSSSEVVIGAGGCGPGGRRCSKCVCPARGLETSGLMLKEHPIGVNRAVEAPSAQHYAAAGFDHDQWRERPGSPAAAPTRASLPAHHAARVKGGPRPHRSALTEGRPRPEAQDARTRPASGPTVASCSRVTPSPVSDASQVSVGPLQGREPRRSPVLNQRKQMRVNLSFSL